MPYSLEQYVDEWRKSEGTHTVQAEELRAEMARNRRASNRVARRLLKMSLDLQGVPKALQELQAAIVSLNEAPSELKKMNRRLTALVAIFTLAAFANPLLASEAGKTLVSFLIHKVVP